MELFTNQILAGISTGAIYACMALAVVMIYQAIDHLNFAQGEMAMFSTFISWQLMQWGVPYWGVFILTIAFSFVPCTCLGLHDQAVSDPVRLRAVPRQPADLDPPGGHDRGHHSAADRAFLL